MTTNFQTTVASVLDATNVTVEWTEAREGTANNETRHVTAPRLDGPDPIDHMAIFLHEVGHIAAPRDHPVGKWQRENVATAWALRAWQLYDLPDFERAEYCLARRLGTYLRSALAEGRATVAEIREAVPRSFLRIVGPLSEPEYISDLSPDAFKRALKSDDGRYFPADMPKQKRWEMVDRLREWTT